MNYLDEAVTKSLDEFMEYYKVVDTEEVYSNGTEFVPIFRVKQWEEYNSKDKEIERLHSIIKEVREYIKNTTYADITGLETHSIKEFWFVKELLEILDKGSE